MSRALFTVVPRRPRVVVGFIDDAIGMLILAAGMGQHLRGHVDASLTQQACAAEPARIGTLREFRNMGEANRASFDPRRKDPDRVLFLTDFIGRYLVSFDS